MSRTRRIIFGVVALGALLAIAGFTYIWVTGGSGQASGAIAAPTLAVESTGGDPVVFDIVPEESEARFLIDEEMFGNPRTVIGRTDQIAGQILINFDNPAASELGTVRVNLRTIVTDSEMRNRAIRGQILQSNDFEFAEFVPSSIEGLPESITLNNSYTFNVIGNLTVRDVTKPATFEARVTPISEDRLHGFASTTVQRTDFGLTIPNAPGIANVGEEVTLELEFVAQAAE